MRSPLAFLVAVAVAASLAACGHHEPPQVDASPASLAISPLAPPQPPVPAPASTIASTVTSATDAGTLADAADLPDAGPDPATLPQTHDKPHADDPALAARAQALWDAVVADDPSLALASFFPLAAYQQVKAIAHPESDWNHRLVAAFGEDIHALHKQLGRNAAQAVFLGLDLPDDRARWVDPGEEYNKIGYYRVFGSKMRYRFGTDIGAARERSFDITSFISWRGQWYIVHLSGVR